MIIWTKDKDVIELDMISKDFGAFRAVDSLSFSAQAGEVLGFLGPNGAGKSTTMKILAGTLTPTAGQAKLCGHDIVTATRKAQSHLGYLPEGAPAWQDMNPDNLLTFLGQVHHLTGSALSKAKANALEMTSLTEATHQPIDTLSKGMKRRVGLAAALLHDPDILILDEPTDGLDPNQKHEVRALITRLSHKKTIIISTHILEEVEAVCGRAIIIAKGRMVADATPAELLARDPNHHAIELVTDLAAEALKSRLQNLPDIANIATIDSATVRLSPAAGQDLTDMVVTHLKAQNIALKKLNLRVGRLDDVFRNLTA